MGPNQQYRIPYETIPQNSSHNPGIRMRFALTKLRASEGARMIRSMTGYGAAELERDARAAERRNPQRQPPLLRDFPSTSAVDHRPRGPRPAAPHRSGCRAARSTSPSPGRATRRTGGRLRVNHDVARQVRRALLSELKRTYDLGGGARRSRSRGRRCPTCFTWDTRAGRRREARGPGQAGARGASSRTWRR